MKKLMFIVCMLLLGIHSSVAEENIEKTFEGFNMQGYNDEGVKEWEVNGSTADIIGTQIKLSDVDANIYGDQLMNVTAEIGYIDQVSGKLLLEEDVIITSETGAQMLTDSLDWDKKADIVMTDDDVMITDDGMTVTGKGLKARPGLENMQIKEDVTVRVDIDPSEEVVQMLQITSDGPMTIDQTKTVAVFEVNVVATIGNDD